MDISSTISSCKGCQHELPHTNGHLEHRTHAPAIPLRAHLSSEPCHHLGAVRLLERVPHTALSTTFGIVVVYASPWAGVIVLETMRQLARGVTGHLTQTLPYLLWQDTPPQSF